MTYAPPKSLIEVLGKIEYEEALAPDDPRFVDTTAARGSQKTFSRLARKLGYDPNTDRLASLSRKHVLFFGHVGSGKTTELRHCSLRLNGPTKFFVVEVDAVALLDPNNIQYSDCLMAQAQSLLDQLIRFGLDADSEAMTRIESWFSTHLRETVKATELGAALETGAEAGAKLPFVAKLFAKFTASVKANVSYKDTLRREIRNSFSQLAEAFNALIRATELMLREQKIAQRILFVIDGTDKMTGEDSRRFFFEDSEQLLQIDTLAVYTGPLTLKYSGNLAGKLDTDLVLPMIKLHDRDGSRFEAGWIAMTQILLLRADRSLFASEAEIARLVEFSGGHPRELLRLLRLCCELAEGSTIDADTVEAAIRQLASEYRYVVQTGDFAVLRAIDSDPLASTNDEITQRLLRDLVLMQYNDGSWRRSHPVVRMLDGYQRAAQPAPAKPA